MSKFTNKILRKCGLITLVEHEQMIVTKNREIIELKKELFVKDAKICVTEAEVERFQYICGKHRMKLNSQTKQLRLAERVLEKLSIDNGR